MVRAAIPSMAPRCAFVVGVSSSSWLPTSQRCLRVATHARRTVVPSVGMRRWAARMATSASSPSSAGGVYYQRILQKVRRGSCWRLLTAGAAGWVGVLGPGSGCLALTAAVSPFVGGVCLGCFVLPLTAR